MNRTEIRETLRRMFEEETDTTFGEFQDDMSLAQEFKLDSVDYMSLIMQVEQHFHIRMSNQELGCVATIGMLVDLVQSKVEQGSQLFREAA